MPSLTLLPTTACNRDCLHCMLNKADSPGFLSLDLAESILAQARDLGFKVVHLTGGEIAVYPHLEELLRLIAEHGFKFTLVSNGFRFQERLFPLLSEKTIRKKFKGVAFSLDGARPESHDAIRGAGAFNEVIQAAMLCRHKKIRMSLKSVLTKYNREELTEMALLGASLGLLDHNFITTFPTPRLLREEAIPSPNDMLQTLAWVRNSLAQTVRGTFVLEGFLIDDAPVKCCSAWTSVTVDDQGRQIICCNISHLTTGDGTPTRFGNELVADLKEVSLKEGLRRHFHLLAYLMESRLAAVGELPGLKRYLCFWCLKNFGKLEWLQNFPDSPWTAGLLGQA